MTKYVHKHVSKGEDDVILSFKDLVKVRVSSLSYICKQKIFYLIKYL